MKIIFVVSAMHGGGAERVISKLANEYARQGNEITILMVAGNEVKYPLLSKINVVSLADASGGNFLLQVSRLIKMRRFFKANKDSRIVSFSTTINMFTILACLGLKNKVVVSERNDPNQYSYKWLRNLFYVFGKQFVFQTEDAKLCFSKRIQNRSRVIPNPIGGDMPKTYSGVREKKIAAVGRLEPQKNHKLLIEAFAEFSFKYPEYELHIFGEGKLKEELRLLAKKLEISHNVVFEGFSENVLERIKAYSMYVLSSDYEGISNSLMEAMALGIPCISTDCPIGGSRLCIEHRKNGLLVPVGDKGALRKAMETLVDSSFAETLGEKACLIREKFSEDTIIKMWNGILE